MIKWIDEQQFEDYNKDFEDEYKVYEDEDEYDLGDGFYSLEKWR